LYFQDCDVRHSLNRFSPVAPSADRTREWFVPRFGPASFRRWIGLLFLPYTGMVLSYTVIGGLLPPAVHWDRIAALALIYFLGLGVGAHALDALGSGGNRPWGEVLPRRSLWFLAGSSLLFAYGLGAYYMIRFAPLLWPIAIAEGFFVFAYNLEWFGGRFHTDWWFAFSWGALPPLAGYVLQTNRLSLPSLCVAAAFAFLSLIEIKVSRPYKELRRRDASGDDLLAQRYQVVLKSLSAGVILLGVGLALARWMS